METKRGRPRLYEFKAPAEYRDERIGRLAAAIREMRLRVYDQIEDLPRDALNFVSVNSTLSIGRLVLHMAYSELSQLRKFSRMEIPPDLQEALTDGALEAFERAPAPSPPAHTLHELCERVWSEVTVPYLADVEDINQARLEDGSTLEAMLMHLIWHWIYHSGHIGLIRLEWGSDYEWVLKRPVVS